MAEHVDKTGARVTCLLMRVPQNQDSNRHTMSRDVLCRSVLSSWRAGHSCRPDTGPRSAAGLRATAAVRVPDVAFLAHTARETGLMANHGVRVFAGFGAAHAPLITLVGAAVTWSCNEVKMFQHYSAQNTTGETFGSIVTDLVWLSNSTPKEILLKL